MVAAGDNVDGKTPSNKLVFTFTDGSEAQFLFIGFQRLLK